MNYIKKLHGFLLVLLCFSSISTGIALSFTQFHPNKVIKPANEELIANGINMDFDINVDNEILEDVVALISTPIVDEQIITIPKEVDSVVSAPIEDNPIISNTDLDLIVSPPKEDDPLIPALQNLDPPLSPIIESIIISPPYDVEINITIDVGVNISLGNDKNRTCPSPNWNFNIVRNASVEYDPASDQILDDLEEIVKGFVLAWIQTVEEKGVRKQLERRYAILNYDVEILDQPMLM